MEFRNTIYRRHRRRHQKLYEELAELITDFVEDNLMTPDVFQQSIYTLFIWTKSQADSPRHEEGEVHKYRSRSKKE